MRPAIKVVDQPGLSASMSDTPDTTSEIKLDATGEFFSVGTPLHALRASYIHRAADDELFEALMSGSNAYVIAPDRSGKSSLIAATSARLRNHDVKVAVIDLAQLGERDGGTDAGRWYYNIAYRLVRQLRLKTDLQSWWQDKAILSNRQRLVEFYIEIVLADTEDRVVIFIDEMQCIADLPFAEHLLASIRAAHNGRVTDPDLARLSFALLGECDPHSLVSNDTISPFVVSRRVRLADFSREQIAVFGTELGLSKADAETALDRIFSWTNGQPYLTQKLARAVARETVTDDINAAVDRLAMQQLAGRAALNNEPHLSHLQKQIMHDRKDREALLTLYGKLRKGIPVIFKPESRQQRKLLALGLVVIAPGGTLQPRNRVYATVFTARWANDNLSVHWRGPLLAAAAVALIVALPFWYTQLLPKPYVRVLSGTDVQLSVAADAYDSLRSFPGHADPADNLYRGFLHRRAAGAASADEIKRLTSYADRLPDGEAFGNELLARYWEQRLDEAMRLEQRDRALIAALESLVVPSSARRRLAANIVGNDYPHLVGTVPPQEAQRVIYDGESHLISFVSDAEVRQWSMSDNRLESRATWVLSALDVTPLVRRLTVDTVGVVQDSRVSVSLVHGRPDDIRMRLIAPSGRAVDLDIPDASRANDGSLLFAGGPLRSLAGEAASGTWSLSVRDEASAVPGQLIQWSLTVNGRRYSDAPERPPAIPDPVARESDEIWLSNGGRYAVARSMHSDSARLWDLLYAQPARTIAVQADERVLGLSPNAEFLVSARQNTVSLWRIRDGRRQTVLDVGAGHTETNLSPDGRFVTLIRGTDTESIVSVWSIENARRVARLTIAGSLAQVGLSADGMRLAVADYDRTVRVWNIGNNLPVAQIDLPLQASRIALSDDGRAIGVLHGDQGLSLWNPEQPAAPVIFEHGAGDWQLAFAPSGGQLIAGNSRDGFQIYRAHDGAAVGPPIGADSGDTAMKLLAFSNDENFVLTASPRGPSRLWRAVGFVANEPRLPAGPDVWRDAFDMVSTIATGGQLLAVGDHQGHVHFLSTAGGDPNILLNEGELSFIGHTSPVAALTFSADASRLVSVDRDGSVRFWDAGNGMPRSYSAHIGNSPVHELVFSPAASRVAISAGQRVWVVDADNGEIVADIDAGEIGSSTSFADEQTLYLAGVGGGLRVLSADRTGGWNLRTVWTGDSELQRVAVSTDNQYVILIDAEHRASLLDVANGRIGTAVLQLPHSVREIVFSPNESRVLFRTARWIHRASLSHSGLVWLDAIRAPTSLRGSGMVIDANENGNLDPLAGRVVMLSHDTGYLEVAELTFAPIDGPTLIGSRDALLIEWRARLGMDLAGN